jgi:hypothetical protein
MRTPPLEKLILLLLFTIATTALTAAARHVFFCHKKKVRENDTMIINYKV